MVRPTYMKYSKTSIICRPRLSTIFETKIQYAQVPRITEARLYYSNTVWSKQEVIYLWKYR